MEHRAKKHRRGEDWGQLELKTKVTSAILQEQVKGLALQLVLGLSRVHGRRTVES